MERPSSANFSGAKGDPAEVSADGASRPDVDPQCEGAGRRIIRHPLVLLPIGFVMVVIGIAVPALVLQALRPGSGSFLDALAGFVVGLGAVGGYLAFRRWIERARVGTGNRGAAARELAAGLATGFGVMSLTTGLVALAGGLEITGVRGMGDLWYWLGIALYSGIAEEVLFRGIVQRQLEAMFGTWAAIAATSAFFGLAHLANPGASLFAAFAIACEAGVLLGAAYVITRSLWMPIGIHMAWNFTQGWIFSIPVSGGAVPRGLLETRIHGPEWLTGGAFGLEASVVALAIAGALGFALLLAARRQGRFLAPRWKRAAGADLQAAAGSRPAS